MKKTLPILIVGFLVLSGLGAVALHVNTDSQLLDDKPVLSSIGDELDQYQIEMTENKVVPVGQVPIPDNATNVQVAQSFIPAKEIFTRVELFIGKNSTATYPYVLAIRDNLTEEDLTQTSVDPGDIPTEEFGWVEFDFDDIMVNTGETYYIISYTENTTENYYAWGANNDSESYPFGCAWFSIDDGETWSNESADSSSSNVEEWVIKGEQSRFDDIVTWDMCFKTYGRDNAPPEIPIIDGPPNGNVGTSYEYGFTSTDPNGDDIAEYIVEWGDETGETITGPFASGTEATASHTWSEQGDYVITAKAKDVYGLVGPEGTLTVTMPRTRATYNSLFLQFLERFPILRHLLRL